MKFLELKDTTTACPYLPDLEFSAENFLAPALRSQEVDRLLAAGFRHFGSYYFRPVCLDCRRCVPLRVKVEDLYLSRSLRRVSRINADLTVAVGPPAPTERSFSLYRKHQLRFEHRSSSSYEQYVRSFFSPTAGNTQLSVFEKNVLVAVLHLDVTSISASAVYCYYDTDSAKRSLGTFAVTRALQVAHEWGLTNVYLGYVVEGNRHMMYKSRYRPNEVLLANGWISYLRGDGQRYDRGKYKDGFPGRELRDSMPFSRILLAPDL